MKVLCVFGTRPEAIKLAPVIMELQRRAVNTKLHPIICVTAQHREMLDQVLQLFDIVPDYDLSIMMANQSLTQVASVVLSRLEPIFHAEKPDWVLVQGDTTTVAAAAMAAFYARIKVGHVEAGLRTWDKWCPYPEEVNRKLASAIADLHFAPTQQACDNLLNEKVPASIILVTGNPVIDALRWITNQPLDRQEMEILDNHNLTDWIEDLSANKLNSSGKIIGVNSRTRSDTIHKILVTVHRRENFGEPLINICLALKDLAEHYSNQISIVYPVHMNPNVWEPVNHILDEVPNIILTPPLGYSPLIHLMNSADLVVTDSGGIQEEAPSLGKPVLVLRDVTERPEAIVAGTVRLLGTDRSRIVEETINLLDDIDEYSEMARAVNPYGDGHAAERIVSALLGEEVTPFEPV
jgi:UDP-N-acetylglucosamine 2-epimerase (non-hydrolysing)